MLMTIRNKCSKRFDCDVFTEVVNITNELVLKTELKVYFQKQLITKVLKLKENRENNFPQVIVTVKANIFMKALSF